MICSGKANEPEDPIAKNEEAFNTVDDSGDDCDKEVWLAVIVKPASPTAGQILTYNATTSTWVASASPVSLPKGTENGQILIYNSSTQAWAPSSVKLQSDGVPVGTIVAYTSATIPPGWLECNGGSFLRATYPDLFKVVGTQFNVAGTTPTYFNVPDLRDLFIRGWNRTTAIS